MKAIVNIENKIIILLKDGKISVAHSSPASYLYEFFPNSVILAMKRTEYTIIM